MALTLLLREFKYAWDVAMYPSSLPTCEVEMEKWASSLRAESYKRFGPLFPESSSHDGQLRLSWGARSTVVLEKISSF